MDQIDRIIEQWRRERPDLDTEAMALVGRIQRAAQALRPRLDATHERFGLTGESFDVLAALRRSGEPYRLTPTQLYRQMMLSSGAMTNRIDRLETQGLVERRPDPNDRRGTLICLTRKGRTLIDKAVGEHVKNEREQLSGLSAKERSQLDALLARLLESLEAD